MTVPSEAPTRTLTGCGRPSTSFQTVHDDDWRFAYNLMAGVSIPASESSRFTIGYRWLHEDVGINCGTGVSCSGSLNSSSIDIGYIINL